MKKILILTTVSGFVYKFEMENVKILQEKGYEVHYAANENLPRYLFDEQMKQKSGIIFHNICIEKSPLKYRENVKALNQIMDIIWREQIQVLHCHTPLGGVLGRMAGKRCEKQGLPLKIIYTAHGFHFYQGAPQLTAVIYRMVETYLAKYTDILVTINREDYENARKFQLRPSGSVCLIPGAGLDMEQYVPVTEKQYQNCREKLGIAENQLFLLSVGEVNENKNHRVVIESLRQLREQGWDISHFKYGICGDGTERKALEQLVRNYHLEKWITFYDYQKDVRPFLWAADVFLFPSRREGLGMAALEALSAGVPVIAADNRGTREYMQHGKNGFVCKWNDSNSYIRYIEKIQQMSLEERKRMKSFCRKSVEKFQKKYTCEIMQQVYEDI